MHNIEPPPVHPIVYVACILTVLHALVMAYTGSLSHLRYIEIISAIRDLTQRMEIEARATRQLLELLDLRRRRQLAREAEIRFEAETPREAHDQILVSRVIDAAQEDRS